MFVGIGVLELFVFFDINEDGMLEFVVFFIFEIWFWEYELFGVLFNILLFDFFFSIDIGCFFLVDFNGDEEMDLFFFVFNFGQMIFLYWLMGLVDLNSLDF